MLTAKSLKASGTPPHYASHNDDKGCISRPEINTLKMVIAQLTGILALLAGLEVADKNWPRHESISITNERSLLAQGHPRQYQRAFMSDI